MDITTSNQRLEASKSGREGWESEGTAIVIAASLSDGVKGMRMRGTSCEGEASSFSPGQITGAVKLRPVKGPHTPISLNTPS